MFKRKVAEYMDFGTRAGWWAGLDAKGNPVQHATHINTSSIPTEQRTLAHLFTSLGCYGSIGEAKKADWGKPITAGEYKFKNGLRHYRFIIAEEIQNG